MKYKRQGQILRIIHEKNIKTHEQLIGELNKCGYNVTQATVSRDIKELGLIKIPLPDGGSVYSSSKDIPEELDRRINMITDTVISVDYAMNNIVVKTYPGMASAVAASVDASMRNEFLGSIAGDDTLLIIEEKQREMQEYYHNKKRGLVPDDKPTSDLNEYTFGIKLKNKSGQEGMMTINFIDYPGEWLGNDRENKEHRTQINENLLKSNVIIIAIDTPYLMEGTRTNSAEEIGKYNDRRNYSQRINQIIKEIEVNKNEPKMILFVPLKCEKYRKEGKLDVVATKIKKAYKGIFDFFDGPNKGGAEIAIIPIMTMGNVYFNHFSRDDEGEIILDEKWKTPKEALYYFSNEDVYGPEPQYCEQPMIYVLMYILYMLRRVMENEKEKLGFFGKLIQKYLVEDFLNYASVDDFIKEEDNLRKKLIRNEEGFEIVQNPLNF